MASELALQTRMLASQIQQAKQPLPPANILQQQVLEKLIVESLQLQMGERSGIKVSKQQLDAAVAGVAAQNKLSTEVFRRELNAQGIPFGMFRENIRRQMILQQVQQAFVIKRIEISDQDVDNFLASEEGRRLATQEAIDKPIDLPIKHFLRIFFFVLRARILHQSVRMEDIISYLTTPIG